MAARPPVCAATTPAPDNLRTLRRVMRAMFPPPVNCYALEFALAQPRTCARRGVVYQPGHQGGACSRVLPGVTPAENTTNQSKPQLQSARGYLRHVAASQRWPRGAAAVVVLRACG